MTGSLRAALVLAAMVSAGVSPQTGGAGSISGQVIAASDGAPVRRVTVTLTSAGASGSRVFVTDDQGRFTFENLPADRFSVTASRPGYVTTAYGAIRSWRSPGVPIVVHQGQKITDITIRLLKGGAITGRITDPMGRPLEDVPVTISEQRMVNGQLTLATVPANGGQPSTFSATSTDDRGVYRIFGLPPGTFVVAAFRVDGDPLRTFEPTTPGDLDWAKTTAGPLSATAAPAPAPAVGYVPMYFPGTADPSAATAIALAAGEERDGADFQIDAVSFSTIAGSVSGPGGEPVSGITLFALRLGSIPGAMSGGIPPLGGTDALGQFVIRGVPPGRYTVLAEPRLRGAVTPGASGSSASPALFARADVVVSGTDISGLSLQLSPGVTVSGRVSLNDRPLPADLLRAKVRLTAPPAPMGASITIPPVDLKADGSFRIDGVGPGSYVLSVTPPASETWMMKSAAIGERDVTNRSFDVQSGQPIAGVVVTMTDRVTEISGLLLDQAGRPAPDFYVLVYPADQSLWPLGKDRLRPAVRPDSAGHYRVVGLPPGDYYIAALPDLQPNDYADSAFLAMLIPASVKVTLAEGEKKTQNVRLAAGG